MDILLSKRKTSQDLLQRCKVTVYESQHRRPARLQTVAIPVQFLYCWHAETNRNSQAVCYGDDLIVWSIWVNIPYLNDNSLLFSASKSSVTLLTPDTHQDRNNPKILIKESQLPLLQCQNIFGVHLDTSLSFDKHLNYIVERVSHRSNILNALSGTSWGQQKDNDK